MYELVREAWDCWKKRAVAESGQPIGIKQTPDVAAWRNAFTLAMQSLEKSLQTLREQAALLDSATKFENTRDSIEPGGLAKGIIYLTTCPLKTKRI